MNGKDFYNVCILCKIDCCRDAKPPITERRRKIIQDYIKDQNLKLDDPFTGEEYVHPREDAEGYCFFYDRETKRCRVHPVKPETCVAGPITFDVNLEQKEIEWYLKMEEICPLAGVMDRRRKLLKEHLNTAKKEIRRLIRELPPQTLRSILQIEEPETFRICTSNIKDEQTLEKIAHQYR